MSAKKKASATKAAAAAAAPAPVVAAHGGALQQPPPSMMRVLPFHWLLLAPIAIITVSKQPDEVVMRTFKTKDAQTAYVMIGVMFVVAFCISSVIRIRTVRGNRVSVREEAANMRADAAKKSA